VTTLNAPQTYSPQAQRDNDTLDLGYHYDPLDWCLGGVLVTNATVTINPGTAIAGFGTNNYGYGLAIGQNATLQCTGAPDKPNWFVQFKIELNAPTMARSVPTNLMSAGTASHVRTPL
jgi:hypothetical protein